MKTATVTLVLLLVAQRTASQNPDYVIPTDSIQFRSGNDLLRECQNTNHMFCLGYITGVTDQIGIIQTLIDKSGNRYSRYRVLCLPRQVEIGEIKDVVVGYLTKHPETRDQGAAELVMDSLMDVWKCPSR